MEEEALGIAVKYVNQYMPHKPIWTAIGVAALADKEMKIEIAVKAKIQDWISQNLLKVCTSCQLNRGPAFSVLKSCGI